MTQKTKKKKATPHDPTQTVSGPTRKAVPPPPVNTEGLTSDHLQGSQRVEFFNSETGTPIGKPIVSPPDHSRIPKNLNEKEVVFVQLPGEPAQRPMSISDDTQPARKRRPSNFQRLRRSYLSAVVRSFDAGALAIMMAKQPPKESEQHNVLGFDRTLIPAEQSAVITKRPQTNFQPIAIHIPAEDAKNFSIIDIKIGKTSQFSTTGEIPATAFSQGGLPPLIKLTHCPIAADVTFYVRNKTKKPAYFEAAIVGIPGDLRGKTIV